MTRQHSTKFLLCKNNYTPSGKNECWEKPQKCTCMFNVLAFFPSLRTSWSLTPQLDTVIFHVSSVKGLSLRGTTLRLYSPSCRSHCSCLVESMPGLLKAGPQWWNPSAVYYIAQTSFKMSRCVSHAVAKRTSHSQTCFHGPNICH